MYPLWRRKVCRVSAQLTQSDAAGLHEGAEDSHGVPRVGGGKGP